MILTNLDTKEYFLRIKKKRHEVKDCEIGFLIQTFHFVFLVVRTQKVRGLEAGEGRDPGEKTLQIHHLI